MFGIDLNPQPAAQWKLRAGARKHGHLGLRRPGDRFGYSLAAGDFNGDNVADLAIGVPGDNTAAGKTGSVLILFGAKGTGLVSDNNQILIQGIGGVEGVALAGDSFGFSLAAGDFNGDNVADLAIGVPGDNTSGVKAGAVNVLYGSATGFGSSGSRIWSQDSVDVPGIAEPDDQFGFSLAAGDFNGDNVADLAVGVPGDNTAGVRGGAVNVLTATSTCSSRTPPAGRPRPTSRSSGTTPASSRSRS